MAVDLLKSVPSTHTRSINFFNGRLLAGEDFTTEQKNNRIAQSLLGQAVGDGVVYGLEVSISNQSNTLRSPMLMVTQGLAVNKNGSSLLLEADTEVALARPATNGTNGNSSTTSIFQECMPTQTGNYIAGSGVYLLTIGPATSTQGLAEVNGISTAQAYCNTKYNVPGVQFRLLSIELSTAELSDTQHLRNVVAYKCFGTTAQNTFAADPFNAPLTTYGLLDDLRSQKVLTNCEVPLAVLYWTANSGVIFVDMWAVRRAIARKEESKSWQLFVDDRTISESKAVFLQFENQLSSLQAGGSPQTIVATDFFRYLPPVGILPVTDGTASPGFSHQQFFSTSKYRDPVFVNGARLDVILRHSLLYEPIDLTTQELIWLYRVRENRQPPTGSNQNTAQPYVIFVTGHAPFYGDARYQLARWDYSNYF